MLTHTVENEKRLSESLLWELQKAAYTSFGPSAWTKKGVPFYLTSTPLIARQYAMVVLGFIRDLMHQALDYTQPLYIFDLGAGSGRFSYLFLKHFLDIYQQVFPNSQLQICYVMTDIAEQNIQFWQDHPLLQSFIEKGLLDFAYYQHTQKDPLKLIKSGLTFSEGALRNPAVLLGNYFFDTIPQDLFCVKESQLQEGRVTLKSNKAFSTDFKPELIPHLELSYSYHALNASKNYYANDPELSAFLIDYAARLGNATFLFPIGAFQTLRYFSRLSPKGYLLICSDQGLASENQVKENQAPKISLHDTFSFPVNYHLLADFFNLMGGKGWLTRMPEPLFVVMCAVWINSRQQYPETAFAFRNTLGAFEPKDYWHLINGVTECEPSLSLDSLIAYLKLGCWDPVNAFFFQEAMLKQIPMASEETKEILTRVIKYIWEEYYPVSLGEYQFIRNLGEMMQQLGHLEEAQLFFERAKNLPYLIKKQLYEEH